MIELAPTNRVRWIRRGADVIMEQWYEDPLGPPSFEVLRRLGEWKAGEFREQITPIISDEV